MDQEEEDLRGRVKSVNSPPRSGSASSNTPRSLTAHDVTTRGMVYPSALQQAALRPALSASTWDDSGTQNCEQTSFISPATMMLVGSSLRKARAPSVHDSKPICPG
eukprot:CAMPEP_0206048286 /NCGR_PEP_ID=MMETSP1466-20131121/23709_1 /ASSEMBLY_ACC=CAM_ASM_001126 /TAXON_ID=44452 /ORGANISM="Pavlova gyrans, Strain CCMP608" /LENGTH=105 /DNA_ID=CAMNT_0053423335 /DNA_START=294 /DNA_END=607 /DNA_ORIENTATION=-